MGNFPSTPMTMLDRLVRGENDYDWNRAWESFVEIYSPAIRITLQRELRKRGFNSIDEPTLRALLSDVVVRFLKSSETFRYDPSKGRFRNFLYTIIVRAVLNHLDRKIRRSPEREFDERSEEIADHGLQDAGTDHDRDWRMATFRLLLEEAKARLGPQTILIFEMTKILEQPVEDVMEQLQVSRSTVDNANARVLKLLRELANQKPFRGEL
jgi:RNA polymerase sigma factor (sigma-70 family)